MTAIRRNKRVVVWTTVLIMVILVFAFVVSAKAKQSVNYEKSFTSLCIAEGDTLTSIAETYGGAAVDTDTYIGEVKNVNNLSSDTIHAGAYLLIPVYEPVQE